MRGEPRVRELRIRSRYANKCLRYLYAEDVSRYGTRDFWKFVISRRKFLDETKEIGKSFHERFAGIIYLDVEKYKEVIVFDNGELLWMNKWKGEMSLIKGYN